jgi:hypothetical protein
MLKIRQILMMLVGPFLMALIPGIIILTLTWWFSKKGFSFFVRMLPGILAIIVAAIISFVLGKKDITVGLKYEKLINGAIYNEGLLSSCSTPMRIQILDTYIFINCGAVLILRCMGG